MANKGEAGNSGKKFEVEINGKRLSVDQPTVNGGELLSTGSFAPAEDYVLIQILRPGSRSIGLDEIVDLQGNGREEFRAFHSKQSFSFTVDEVGYEWGAATIAESDLRDIAKVPEGKVLFLVREDEAEQVIPAGGSVDLSQSGTEHLKVGKRTVTVFYRDAPFEIERGTYTGAQLAATFNVPAGYILDLVKPNDFDEIGSTESVHIREGMHFVSHPPAGQSS